MAKIVGKIIDKLTGQQIEARVMVLCSWGGFFPPPNAIHKVGDGLPFFYSDGTFEVDRLPGGFTRILVERGTEYTPKSLDLEIPEHGVVSIDIELERWTDLQERGWHPGNTHIHYNEREKRPDQRLRLDSRMEDLRVTCVSIARRGNPPIPYATNQYSPGMLTEFCTAHHHVECAEENRHDAASPTWTEAPTHGGYGHIMLLRLWNVVEPISRGPLVDETDPDYPPLCYACDDTHRQGGIVIWCHNGKGMEAPVTAALGKLDAFNLFDPVWMDPDYQIWYAMLNCGFRLPASTGSDWFLCSANRVYAYTGRAFQYDDWIKALVEGRTFITNGPALFLSVNDKMPGDTVAVEPGSELHAMATWKSHYAIHRVEILWNGKVIAGRQFQEGSNEGSLEADVESRSDGWLAARIYSSNRDSFSQPIFAHTSPVYIRAGIHAPEQPIAAAEFDRAIEQSLEWVRFKGRFRSPQQQKEVLDLFRQGQTVYRKLSAD